MDNFFFNPLTFVHFFSNFEFFFLKLLRIEHKFEKIVPVTIKDMQTPTSGGGEVGGWGWMWDGGMKKPKKFGLHFFFLKINVTPPKIYNPGTLSRLCVHRYIICMQYDIYQSIISLFIFGKIKAGRMQNYIEPCHS